MTSQISIGRTWKLCAYRYDNGEFMHVGERWWVEMHGIQQPLVPVLVEEILGDLYAPEVTHYAWEDHDRPYRVPAMVQHRAGPDPSKALMLLDMCFTYGFKVEVERGKGHVLALRITERSPEET